ncbi:unnamed protein product [Meloidogyne enterolobii]|uniref:Uncharacterized protein n=1 Tax=Meloidogyne enterolobii TaxID=390850 RepID=A0ACB0ZLU9_MELEN
MSAGLSRPETCCTNKSGIFLMWFRQLETKISLVGFFPVNHPKTAEESIQRKRGTVIFKWDNSLCT